MSVVEQYQGFEQGWVFTVIFTDSNSLYTLCLANARQTEKRKPKDVF